MEFLYIVLCLVLISCLTIAVYSLIKEFRRPLLKWRLSKAADTLINSQLNCVKVHRKIAVGNAGAVYLVSLKGAWHEQLGIRWSAECEFPELIVLKLARFMGREKSRIQILLDLAIEILPNSHPDQLPPLCPFLALGLIEVPDPAHDFVVEIMPVIEGELLQDIINTGELKNKNPRDTIEQLIQILSTAVYLENLNFYTRNLDAENVIVQPDGKWIRIDFDNVTKKDKKSAKRLRRLCRFSVSVLEQLKNNSLPPYLLDLISKINATQHHLERTGHIEGAEITNATQLIDEIKAMKNLIN